MNTSFRIFLAIILAILTNISFAGTPLFNKGKSEWTIFIPVAPTEPEKFAANELQRVISSMAQIQMPIRQSDLMPKANGVIIGSLGSSKAIKTIAKQLKLTKSEEEQIAIYTLNRNLYLAGNSPRAALFSVYEFLKKQLGVRWLWYGNSGEFIPEMTSYQLPSMSYNFTPSFKYRQFSIGYSPNDKEAQLWLIRNGLNSGNLSKIQEKTDAIKIIGQHLIGIDPKYFKEHPEYFCLINGKRSKVGTSGCWSNEGFFKIQVDKCLKKLAEKWDMIAIYPWDVSVRCECDKCRALHPDPSTRWWKFYDKLITRLKKTYTNQKFAGIAYQEYRSIPACKIKQIDYVKYCQYNRCWIHDINDPKCGINKQYREELEKWQEKANMGIYDYSFDIFKISKSAYLPFWNMLKDQTQYFKDSGNEYIAPEVPPRTCSYTKDFPRNEQPYTTCRIALYVYARLLWDANLTIDEILSNWCATAYGPAASQMFNYHRIMASAWDNMNTCITYFHNAPTGLARYFLNEDTIKKATEQLNAARKNIQKESAKNARYLEEFVIERKLFDEWVTYYSMTKENAKLLPVLKTGLTNAPKHYLNGKDGEKSSSYAQFSWNENGIEIKVFCDAQGEYKKGSSTNAWDDCDTIEIFLTTDDGQGYKHFAVNPAGGKYDGANWNAKWEGKWTAKAKIDKIQWSVEVVIPFTNFNSTPKPGTVWHLTVNYNRSDKVAVGFPFPAYHDSSAGADIMFSNQKKERELIWISGKKSDLTWYKLGLTREGFSPEIFTYGEAEKSKLDDAAMVVIYCYLTTGIKQSFFNDKLVKEVKNGAVVVFNIGVSAPLDKYFADKELKIESQPLDKGDRTVKLSDDYFSKIHRQNRSDYPWNSQGAFLPAFPKRWKAVTKQKTLTRGFLPSIMYTRYGKGMIVAAKSIRDHRNDIQVAKFLNDLLTLNSTLNEEEAGK